MTLKPISLFFRYFLHTTRHMIQCFSSRDKNKISMQFSSVSLAFNMAVLFDMNVPQKEPNVILPMSAVLWANSSLCRCLSNTWDNRCRKCIKLKVIEKQKEAVSKTQRPTGKCPLNGVKAE